MDWRRTNSPPPTRATPTAPSRTTQPSAEEYLRGSGRRAEAGPHHQRPHPHPNRAEREGRASVSQLVVIDGRLCQTYRTMTGIAVYTLILTTRSMRIKEASFQWIYCPAPSMPSRTNESPSALRLRSNVRSSVGDPTSCAEGA